MKYVVTNNEGDRTLTAIINGELYHAESFVHPRFDALVAKVEAGDESVVDDFNATLAVSNKLHALTERLTLSGNTLFFDGVEINDAFTETLVRFFEEEVGDWKPLAEYYEKIMVNMEQHSRENLSRWVKAQNLTITEEGDIVGYKGMYTHEVVDGVQNYRPTNKGHGFVNGEEVVNGWLVQTVGDVVTMPRNEVTHDPAQTCSAGLHVGTYAYASGYGNTVMSVIINPRDVVSVPNDAGGQKVRVCRYRNVEVVDRAYSGAVYSEPKPVGPTYCNMGVLDCVTVHREY